jgi:hypothetical protein
MQLNFYTKPDCSLCDEALEIIRLSQLPISLNKIDISRDKGLMVKYGIRIPVLAKANGEELGWPFSADSLRSWLSSES